MKRQSHIEQLIQNLCPNGVKYMPLGEVCRSIRTGLNPRKNFVLNTQGANLYYVTVKEITTGKIIFSDNTDRITEEAWNRIQERSMLEKDDILFSGIGTIGKVAIADIPIDNWNCSESVFLIKPNKSLINPKYLMYYLGSEQCKEQYESDSVGSTLKGVRKGNLVSLQVPLPPLSIQEEIVRIMDAFANLIENIDTEIKERERQLESALNANYNSSFEKVQISSLGTITRGRRFVRTDIMEQGTPCIHYGDIYTRYPICVHDALTFLQGEIIKKMRYAKNGDVVYVGAGENDEDIGMAIAWLGKEPAAVHDACYILSNHNQDAKYLAYMSRANNFHQQLKMSVASGKICSIPPDGLGRVKIPLPPLAEQRAIAEKLDTIEALIANLKTERDLRQQQYEYYREYLINLLK